MDNDVKFPKWVTSCSSLVTVLLRRGWQLQFTFAESPEIIRAILVAAQQSLSSADISHQLRIAGIHNAGIEASRH